MLVSNFTLGFNSVATFEIGWTAGYSLQITNLAGTPIDFDIECRITNHYFGGTGPGDSVASSLNSLLSREFHTDANGFYHQQTVRIDANRSKHYNLQPWIRQDRNWSPYVDGYVIMRVPVVRSERPPYGLVPQGKTPIPVLLSARRIDDWMERHGPDQANSSQSSFPLASGKAYNEIPPETEPYQHPIRVREYVDALVKGAGKIAPARGSMGLPEEDRAQALIDLLRQMDDGQAGIAALNRLLEDSKSPVRVVESDRKSRK
jgi:hypothetical protein